MKQIFYFGLFSTLSLQAQVNNQNYALPVTGTINTEYAIKVNEIFANLDKTKIPHKLLVDYAMEF